MEIDDIKYIIEAYGVFWFIVLLIVSLLLKNGEKLQGLVKRCNRCVRHNLKDWLLSEPEPTLAKKEITGERIDDAINLILAGLMHRFNACRAYVFQYHEYDIRLTPVPYIYLSNTHELTNSTRAVTSEKDKLQNIPISAIPVWVRRLAEDGSICLDDINQIKEEDLEAFKTLENQQISSVYCVSLLDFRGQPIGFAGLDYCKNLKSWIVSDKDKERLMMECIKIAGLLTLQRNGTLEQLAGTL